MKNNFKNILYWFLFLILITIPVEIFSRTYWAVGNNHLSFLLPEKEYIFYPELRKIALSKNHDSGKYFDVLCIGASVMFSVAREEKMQKYFQDVIGQKTGKTVRIFNAAGSGHTTLDNYYKYKYLEKQKYDLVVYYDAINEVRANNCPPSMFSSNYSHYSWYQKVNFLEAYPFFKFFTLPYTIYSLAIDVLEKYSVVEYVPKNAPKPEWMRFGGTIKTSDSYYRNLIKIVNLANKKQEAILLIKFATYIPSNYTEEKYLQKKLDYAYGMKLMMPIEVWGRVDNVVKGIVVHNDVLEKIANENRTYFLDANKFLPKNGKYFSDICHLSDLGKDTFIKALVNYINVSLSYK